MKAIAIMTDDFTVYHDLIVALRARELPFVSLEPGSDVPSSVGVVIMAEGEVTVTGVPTVAVARYPRDAGAPIPEVQSAIDGAIGHLRGGIRKITIGVDPGKYPGVAVLADGYLIHTYHLTRTETLRTVVRDIRRFHKGPISARVGNGSPVERDLAISILVDEGISVQVVDEGGTTKKGVDPDVRAAIHIARYSPVIRFVERT
jgi:hypothetical protein